MYQNAFLPMCRDVNVPMCLVPTKKRTSGCTSSRATWEMLGCFSGKFVEFPFAPLADRQTDVQTTAVATCYGRVFVVVVVCHPLWFLSSPPLFTPLLSCLSSPVKQRANGGEDKFNIKFVSIFNAGNGQMFHIAKVLSSNDFCHFWRGNGGCMKPSSSSSFFSRQKRSSCQLSSPPPFGWGRERREGWQPRSWWLGRRGRKKARIFFSKKKRVGNGSVLLSFYLRPPYLASNPSLSWALQIWRSV